MAVERVVYVLGAGFSAPLGLPVVRNFLSRAKDLYYLEPDPPERFKSVFDTVQQLANIKNYFRSDLFDIEEILSVLDMRAHFDGNPLAAEFGEFVCDVIERCTPEGPSETSAPFQHAKWGGYEAFVSGVLGAVEWSQRAGDVHRPRCRRGLTDIRYDIISLNYDCVMEKAASRLARHYNAPELHFQRVFPQGDGSMTVAWLAKLHGCVSTRTIVPPTWRKGDHNTVEQWAAARDLLRQANHVRVLGYSLPLTDAYVRYLFKAAASEAPHLKTFDIITLDRDGSVQKRFEEFITFGGMRFRNEDLGSYLETVRDKRHGVRLDESTNGKLFDLERAHSAFMPAS